MLKLHSSLPDCVLQEAEAEIPHANSHRRGVGDMSHMWKGESHLHLKKWIESNLVMLSCWWQSDMICSGVHPFLCSQRASEDAQQGEPVHVPRMQEDFPGALFYKKFVWS